MVSFATPRKTASTVTAAMTASAGVHTPVDATAAAVTITLPTGAREGGHLSIEKVDATANVVTVAGNIRGTDALIPLNYRYETLELIADASGSWRVISNHLPKAAVDAKIAVQTAADAATYPAMRSTEPSATDRAAGVVAYIDKSVVPPVLKGWSGSAWVALGGSAAAAVSTVDNGDGTFTATGSGVTDNGDGTFTITDSTVTANADGTYSLAA